MQNLIENLEFFHTVTRVASVKVVRRRNFESLGMQRHSMEKKKKQQNFNSFANDGMDILASL